ncbi:MAG: hypothetical protein IPP94_05845 [Ignavibacteria bacterium]|nr:hypothetical protein [Ignavibacteria bacterium]
MKSGRMFWAVLFITVGALGLLQNLSIMTWAVDGLWKFWPLVLILIGVSTIFRDQKFRWIFSGAAGLLVGLIGFSIANHGCNVIDNEWNDDTTFIHQKFVEDYEPSTTSATLLFEAGAGTFSIGDTTGSLIVAECESSVGRYELSKEDSGSAKYLSLGMENSSMHWRGNMRNSVEVKLNPTPAWDMIFKVGAASVDFDLSMYIVRKVTFEGGASSVDLTLGDRNDETSVDIETGVSSITVRIPVTVDCEIRTDAALSSKDFEGFSKTEPGIWRTDEYGSKKKKLSLNIEAGISSIHVVRY